MRTADSMPYISRKIVTAKTTKSVIHLSKLLFINMHSIVQQLEFHFIASEGVIIE